MEALRELLLEDRELQSGGRDVEDAADLWMLTFDWFPLSATPPGLTARARGAETAPPLWLVQRTFCHEHSALRAPCVKHSYTRPGDMR